jgi:predicted phosphodiesterase
MEDGGGTLDLRGGDLDGPVALLGGVYSNHLALIEAIADARRRGAAPLLCLGDLGGFGPNPGKIYPLLHASGVRTLAGNYDQALAARSGDCGCGYTHPEDNRFAQISYDYTSRRTTDAERRWLGALPGRIRFTRGGRRFLLCHGSPRRANEFLFDSTCSDAFLMRLAREADADVVCMAHTGLHWQRLLPDGTRFINVGAVGRPANDGRTEVWYALLPERSEEAQFLPTAYDHRALAREMREERLPEAFVQTILTGWWTTCLEVLPARERSRGRY